MNQDQRIFVNCLRGTEACADVQIWIEHAFIVFKAFKHIEALSIQDEKNEQKLREVPSASFEDFDRFMDKLGIPTPPKDGAA